MNWGDEKVLINLSRDLIKNNPPYDHAVPLNREYEDKLSEYYSLIKRNTMQFQWKEDLATGDMVIDN